MSRVPVIAFGAFLFLLVAGAGCSQAGTQPDPDTRVAEETSSSFDPDTDTSEDFVALEGRELIEHEVEGLLYSHYEQVGNGDLNRAYENFGPSACSR